MLHHIHVKARKSSRLFKRDFETKAQTSPLDASTEAPSVAVPDGIYALQLAAVRPNGGPKDLQFWRTPYFAIKRA
jgi:hypothetical protein